MDRSAGYIARSGANSGLAGRSGALVGESHDGREQISAVALPRRAAARPAALSEGHGRALLAIGDNAEISRIAALVVENGWSVREAEALARGEGPTTVQVKPRLRKTRPPVRALHAEQRRIEDALRRHLGTDVKVCQAKGRGTITISYYSNDDMARLLELMLGKPFE
jgi:ParB family chromosome partitioning protein